MEDDIYAEIMGDDPSGSETGDAEVEDEDSAPERDTSGAAEELHQKEKKEKDKVKDREKKKETKKETRSSSAPRGSSKSRSHHSTKEREGAKETAREATTKKGEAVHGRSGGAGAGGAKGGAGGSSESSGDRQGQEKTASSAPESKRVDPPISSSRRTKDRGRIKFFIVKSFEMDNVRTSQRDGIWATQTRLEDKFNKAFDTADRVILFFSVNNSKHFQGYATMLTRTGRSQSDVWAGSNKNKWSGTFKLHWDVVLDLPFQRTLHIRNPLNEDKPVKISRDGQEVPYRAGIQLKQLFDDAKANGVDSLVTPRRKRGRGGQPREPRSAESPQQPPPAVSSVVVKKQRRDDGAGQERKRQASEPQEKSEYQAKKAESGGEEPEDTKDADHARLRRRGERKRPEVRKRRREPPRRSRTRSRSRPRRRLRRSRSPPRRLGLRGRRSRSISRGRSRSRSRRRSRSRGRRRDRVRDLERVPLPQHLRGMSYPEYLRWHASATNQRGFVSYGMPPLDPRDPRAFALFPPHPRYLGPGSMAAFGPPPRPPPRGRRR